MPIYTFGCNSTLRYLCFDHVTPVWPLGLLGCVLMLLLLELLLSDTVRCSIAFCVCPALTLESDVSSSSPSSFLWGMAFRVQDLGPECAHCYWVLFFWAAQMTALGSVLLS